LLNSKYREWWEISVDGLNKGIADTCLVWFGLVWFGLVWFVLFVQLFGVWLSDFDISRAKEHKRRL